MRLWHTTFEKRINSYRLQYWMYAVLNKGFGRNLVFVRDSLHHRYEVNRHGFTVRAQGVEYQEVLRYIARYLESCGYQLEDTKQKNQTSQCFIKTTQRLTGKETLYISFSYGQTMRGEKVLSVYPRAYWQANK